LGCALSQQRIAPYWGADSTPNDIPDLEVSVDAPPSLSWHEGNGWQMFHNDRFVVQALDPSTGAVYAVSPQSGSSWTPSRSEWDSFIRGRGDQIQIRVVGWQSSDPETGPYDGCVRTLKMRATDAIVNSSACTATVIPPNDDSSSTVVNLPFPINYFGATRTYAYVN
jgi:hypothetical protein